MALFPTLINLLTSTSSFLEFYTVETRSLFDVFFREYVGETRPIGEACLVSTLSSKAKKETEVQSTGCNVREDKDLHKTYSNGPG